MVRLIRLPASISSTNDRRLLQSAAKIPELPPGATTQDVRMFCEALVENVKDGLSINAKDTGGYSFKTVARKVIVAKVAPQDVRLPASPEPWIGWDGLRIKELTRWVPDEGEYLEPISTLSCEQARNFFAMPPVWISCFACYAGSLSKQQHDALRDAKSLDILTAIEKFRRDDGFSPSLMTVADALM